MHLLRINNPFIGKLVPILLWIGLWISVGSGHPRAIMHPGSLLDLLNGLRSISPFVIASVAVIIILMYRTEQHRYRMLIFGPLGWTFIYGCIGLGASLSSPEIPTAIYWAAIYLSVPLVIWGIVSGSDPIGRASLILNVTTLTLILAVVSLFATAVISMDMADSIKNPANFLRCQDIGHWLTQTSGVLRSTGVGRYAAIVAIIAICSIYQRKWPWVYGVLLLVSLMLLTTSGSRTSLVGLIPAVGLIILIYGGKKTAISVVLALVVLIPATLFSGIGRPILENCLLRQATNSVTQEVQAPTLLNQNYIQHQDQPITLISPSSSTEATPYKTQELNGESRSIREILLSESLRAPSENQITLEPSVPQREPKSVSRINSILNLSGRSRVWEAGWELFADSPVFGRGFHADRLLLESHMHNAYLQALVQTGLFGTAFFITALLWAWILFAKALKNLQRLSITHKHSTIQVGALLAFLSIRSIPESSGAFFGVDWILIALVFVYLQIINHTIDECKHIG